MKNQTNVEIVNITQNLFFSFYSHQHPSTNSLDHSCDVSCFSSPLLMLGFSANAKVTVYFIEARNYERKRRRESLVWCSVSGHARRHDHRKSIATSHHHHCPPPGGGAWRLYLFLWILSFLLFQLVFSSTKQSYFVFYTFIIYYYYNDIIKVSNPENHFYLSWVLRPYFLSESHTLCI